MYEIGKEETARIFTIEKEEKNTTFLCSWVLRNDKRTHLNYNMVPKNDNKYKDTLVKIYEGSIKEMIAYTPGEEDSE